MSLQNQVCGLQDPNQKGNKTKPPLQSLSCESISHCSANTLVLVLMSLCTDFGEADFRRHSWTCGFSTPVLNQIDMVLLQQFTEDMNCRRSGSTSNGYEMSTPLVMSHHSLCQQRVEWARQHRHSTRDLRACSVKKEISYEKTMNWIRCCLSFALLRASIMSIRGARSSRRHPATEGTLGPIDLQLAEGRIY